MSGFDEKYEHIASVRRGLLESEREWGKSIIDLYNFAIQNHRYFRASKEQIIVANPEVLDQFNKKIGRSNDLRKKYLTDSQNFEKTQTSTFSDLGVSARDFGLNP